MVKPFEIFEEKSNCQKIIILIINLQVWSSQEKDRKKNKAVKKNISVVVILNWLESVASRVILFKQIFSWILDLDN